MDTHAPGSGGQNKTKSRLERGGKGTLQWRLRATGYTQYSEWRWQEGGSVLLTGPLATRWGPQGGMVTSSVLVEDLAPWPWPLTLVCRGGEVAYEAVQVPYLQRTASPGLLALQIPVPEGEAWGVTFAHHPHCPVQVTEGNRTAVPAPCKGGGHFLLWSVSWNLVLVYRRWKPFLLMVSSEWNFTRTESPAEYTSSGGPEPQ